MVMVHRSEGAPNHRVLKVPRAIHRRDFGRECLSHAEVPGAPGDAFAQADQSGGNSAHRHGRFTPMAIPCKVRLHAAREIETSFDRGADAREFFERHHNTTPALIPFSDFDRSHHAPAQGPHEGQAGEPDQGDDDFCRNFQQPPCPGLLRRFVDHPEQD